MEQNMEQIIELKEMIRALKEKETNEELLFGRMDNYKAYKTLFEEREIKDFKQLLLNTIDFYLNNRSVEKYDLEISCDESVEVIESKLVEEYVKLIDCIKDENNICEINKETNLGKIKFIYFKLEISNSNHNITIFKRFIKPQISLRQSIKFKILGNKMQRINEDILYLDSSVAAIEYNGKFYIFDRNYFNSLFKFRDMYCKLIENNAVQIRESDFIDDPEAFIEKCKNNRSLCKKNI